MRSNSFGILAATGAVLILLMTVEIYRYNNKLGRYGTTAMDQVDEMVLEAEAKSSVSDMIAHDNALLIDVETLPVLTSSTEEEIDLGHGFYEYDRRVKGKNPELLIMVLTKDAHSWGHNVDAPYRTIDDFITMIRDTHFPAFKLSLALLTADRSEYERYKSVTAKEGFARTSIYLHPGYSADIDRDARHAEAIQVQRRREIARIRNFLMFSALEKEPHVIWLDSDIQYLEPGIVQAMLHHVTDDKPQVGLMTAPCAIGPIDDYDANSFAFTRDSPTNDPYSRNITVRVGALVDGTSDGDLVELDSIGGTILYMRSSLIKQGLGFTYQSIIGTTWEHEGFDGLETEGLCYRAKPLGSTCWVMGGKWKVRHTDR